MTQTVKVMKPFNLDDDEVIGEHCQKYLRETKETKWGWDHPAASSSMNESVLVTNQNKNRGKS